MALVLDSLMIRGFRSLQRLDVDRLGRANLLVGRNGSGKSSVLEALKLYATQGTARAVFQILHARDEIAEYRESGTEPDRQMLLPSIQQLFFGRPSAPSEIVIGSRDIDESRLTMSLTSRASLRLQVTPVGIHWNYELRDVVNAWRTAESTPVLCPHQFVSPNGMNLREIASFWDAITLTPLEDDVVRAMRIIAPGLERVSFVATPNGERVPMAKLRDEAYPVPVRSLGDGVTRLFGIALGLVRARDGLLLIDEAENGIHFSAQTDLWRLIFATAAELNVQVFATTHSWDCIQAFQEAAASDPHEEAALIRLESRDGMTVPTIFSERDLSVVTREQIEVR
jgi:predicted ATPase